MSSEGHVAPALGPNILRYQLAACAAGVAVCLIFIAVKFQSKEFLTSKVSERRSDAKYSRMWFDRTGSLVGAAQKANIVTVSRWSNGRSAFGTWTFTLTDPANQADSVHWTMSPDLSRLAWVSGSTLFCRVLAEGRPTASTPLTVPLPPKSGNIQTFGILSDLSVATITGNGSVA